jgi:hypothetical protein
MLRVRGLASCSGERTFSADPGYLGYLPTLFALGFDWSMVRAIPAGGTSKLTDMPINRTLIKEQHDPTVFVVGSQKLRSVSPAVMEAECLPWRHVRVVPDTTLSALPHTP